MTTVLPFPKKPIRAAIAATLLSEHIDRARLEWQADVRQMVIDFAMTGPLCYPGHRPDISLHMGLDSTGMPIAFMN